MLGSPLHAIADYERELGLPHNAINRVVADTAPHGAWSRLERGELAAGFLAQFWGLELGYTFSIQTKEQSPLPRQASIASSTVFTTGCPARPAERRRTMRRSDALLSCACSFKSC